MTLHSTTESFYDEEDIIPMTPAVQIPSGIGLSLLIVIGICGNVLTVIAFFKHKDSGTVYDFFIVNLAFTDLMLCCSSMTFYAVYTLMEFTWPFGYTFCKVWLVMDFTLCFETILLMLILSLDRLLMISMGPSYTRRVTLTIARVQVAVSWIISFLVYGPAIIGWNHWVGYSTVEDMDCDTEFAYNRVFTIATAIVEFIIPFVGLTLLNLLLYLKIKKRTKVRPERNYQVAIQTIQAGSSSGKTDTKDMKKVQTSDHKSTNQEVQRNTSRSQGHVKAAKFLASLVIAFLLFWAPYTITTIVISFCPDCVGISLYEFFNWLLWMKSAVNPFLYAFNSLRYRNVFLKYLTLNGRLCKNKIGVEQPTTSRSVY